MAKVSESDEQTSPLHADEADEAKGPSDNSEYLLNAQTVSQTLAKHCYCHTPVTVESIVTGGGMQVVACLLCLAR